MFSIKEYVHRLSKARCSQPAELIAVAEIPVRIFLTRLPIDPTF